MTSAAAIVVCSAACPSQQTFRKKSYRIIWRSDFDQIHSNQFHSVETSNDRSQFTRTPSTSLWCSCRGSKGGVQYINVDREICVVLSDPFPDFLDDAFSADLIDFSS